MEHDKRRPSRKPDSRLGKLRQRFAKAVAAPPRKPQRVLPPEATPCKGPAPTPPKAPAPPPTPATPGRPPAVARSRTTRSRQELLYEEAMRSNQAMCEELEALFGSLSDLEDEPTPTNSAVPEAPEAPLVAANAVPPTPPPTPGVPSSTGNEDPPANIAGSPGSGPFQGYSTLPDEELR
ncbi:PREDICTED: vegetative cell wall protein gp1-like, partial [Vollenhovia emeryi]|uniref:vegetative cell wall protein gp1-like n=1 Tax=Vollenhovia emeryi TaxID=411798 RepID=UPI0005F45AEE